jgi:phage tail-like protein
MATSAVPSRPLNTDPLRSFKFNVYIPLNFKSSKGNGIATFGFMSMQGLGIAVEPLTYREGGDNLTPRKMPGQVDFNAVTFQRGLFPMDNDNFEWMKMIFTAVYGNGAATPLATRPAFNAGASVGSAPDFRTNIYVNMLQHPNTTPSAVSNATVYNASWPQQNTIVQVSWKLYSAWMGSLAYSDLDAGGNAVAVEMFTLNYEGFDVLYGGGGYIDSNTVNQW